MTVENATFTVWQNEEQPITFTVTSADTAAAINVSAGYTFRFIVRQAGANALDITAAGRFSVGGASSNEVTITLTEAETGALSSGTAPFQFWVTTTSSTKTEIGTDGTVTIKAGYAT